MELEKRECFRLLGLEAASLPFYLVQSVCARERASSLTMAAVNLKDSMLKSLKGKVVVITGPFPLLPFPEFSPHTISNAPQGVPEESVSKPSKSSTVTALSSYTATGISAGAQSSTPRSEDQAQALQSSS